MLGAGHLQGTDVSLGRWGAWPSRGKRGIFLKVASMLSECRVCRCTAGGLHLRWQTGRPGLGAQLGAPPRTVCTPESPSLSRSAMSSEPPPPPQPPTHQASAGLLDTQRARERSPSPLRGNVVPSPLPTRRTRTFSA